MSESTHKCTQESVDGYCCVKDVFAVGESLKCTETIKKICKHFEPGHLIDKNQTTLQIGGI
jgi:hypothetical protein